MQILFASAKIMNSRVGVETALASVPVTTVPRFADDARRLVLDLSTMSVGELAAAFHSSEAIARENYLRYHNFFVTEEELPAVLAYHGQAYKYLRAETFGADDHRFAQDHLLITSFLYGLLRPLDMIHPCRLEGKVRLPSAGDGTLFEFWRERLTDMLVDAVKADDGVLLHLATEEMQHLFCWDRVCREVRVVQPLFYQDQGSRLKVVAVHAKSCRGAMGRYAITNRLTSPDALTTFSTLGYRYRETMGDAQHPHFVL